MKIYIYLGYLFAFAALATGITGIELLSIKPTLPFAYEEVNDTIIVSEDYQGIILKGSTIKEFNSHSINDINQIEFLSDALSTGDEVTLKLQKGKIEYPVNIKLEKAYKDNSFLYISGIIGLTFWFLGFFVFVRKTKETPAKILFAMLIFFSVAIMTSPGKYYGDLYSYTLLSCVSKKTVCE
jgi:hypothetical protein